MKRKVNPNAEGQQPQRKKHKVYEFGNYHRYYGYRVPNHDDPRLLAMEQDWFNDKSVLDIGCNTGNVLLWIASTFSPWRCLGVDVDGRLIGRARKKLERTAIDQPLTVKQKDEDKKKEINEDHQFPNNVEFKTANFITETVKEYQKFDVILCLSVSKWIHLNWGDKGLMDLFKKVYRMLEPGGKFILEPQPWDSYKKKKNITETIKENFKSLEIKPTQFTEILLGEEVGFLSYEQLTVDYPEDYPKGFAKRPILVFHKKKCKVPNRRVSHFRGTESTTEHPRKVQLKNTNFI